jgi:hypothetical protein
MKSLLIPGEGAIPAQYINRTVFANGVQRADIKLCATLKDYATKEEMLGTGRTRALLLTAVSNMINRQPRIKGQQQHRHEFMRRVREEVEARPLHDLYSGQIRTFHFTGYGMLAVQALPRAHAWG